MTVMDFLLWRAVDNSKSVGEDGLADKFLRQMKMVSSTLTQSQT